MLELSVIPVMLLIFWFVSNRSPKKATEANHEVDEASAPVGQATKKLTHGERIRDFAENPQKFWIIGFVVVLVGTTLLYTILSDKGANRLFYVGILTVVGMHIFIAYEFYRALFYKEPFHLLTRIFIGAVIVFWSIAVFLPNTADRLITNTKNTVSAFDENVMEPAGSIAATPRVSSASKPVMREFPPQTLHVVPGGVFQKADTPVGARVMEKITFDCPQGCISQVEHDGYRMCDIGNGESWDKDRHGNIWYVGSYQGTKCIMTTIRGTEGVERFRERFLKIPKSEFHYPRDLVRVIFTFGADWGIYRDDPGFGPVDVFVTTVTSS